MLDQQTISEKCCKILRKDGQIDQFILLILFGGALTANFLGEEGEKENSESLVKAACTVGCPWDFVDGAYHLQKSWTGKYLLSPALAKF